MPIQIGASKETAYVMESTIIASREGIEISLAIEILVILLQGTKNIRRSPSCVLA
jgi:hypothetical protein